MKWLGILGCLLSLPLWGAPSSLPSISLSVADLTAIQVSLETAKTALANSTEKLTLAETTIRRLSGETTKLSNSLEMSSLRLDESSKALLLSNASLQSLEARMTEQSKISTTLWISSGALLCAVIIETAAALVLALRK